MRHVDWSPNWEAIVYSCIWQKPREEDDRSVVEDRLGRADGHVHERVLPHLLLQLHGSLPPGVLDQHLGGLNQDFRKVKIFVLEEVQVKSITNV